MDTEVSLFATVFFVGVADDECGKSENVDSLVGYYPRICARASWANKQPYIDTLMHVYIYMRIYIYKPQQKYIHKCICITIENRK